MIYLDYAATTPVRAEVFDAVKELLSPQSCLMSGGANANSLHSPGRQAFKLLENARRETAKLVGAKRPDEIIFTSGATESNNAAIKGILLALEASQAKGAKGASEEHRQQGQPLVKGQVLCSAIEHDSVLDVLRSLTKQGYEAVYIKPDSRGFITPEALKQALSPQTKLVSIQAANSEVGSLQHIKELSRICHDAGVLFHTDATQALGKIPVNVSDWGVDAASFSAHKIGAYKGCGVLYLKSRTPFVSTMLGGGQESGRRSGTQNVIGACAFAAALRSATDQLSSEHKRLAALRDKLYSYFATRPECTVSAFDSQQSDAFLPNIVHVMVDGLESQTMILRFDDLGFALSGGSACSSSSLEPSHVLLSMGIAKQKAQGALRVSFGWETTEEDIQSFISAYEQVISWR